MGSLKLALLTATSDLCFHRSLLPSYLLLCFKGSKLALESIYTEIGVPQEDVRKMEEFMPECYNAQTPTVKTMSFMNLFCYLTQADSSSGHQEDYM